MVMPLSNQRVEATAGSPSCFDLESLVGDASR